MFGIFEINENKINVREGMQEKHDGSKWCLALQSQLA